MYQVYILQSIQTGRYYIGHTVNIGKRLQRHNDGNVRSTKNYRPWEIVFTEEYRTKSDAYRRELEIKSYKGGNGFKNLISKIN